MENIKTPPNNTEAERAVLGSILIDTTGRGDDRIMDLCLTSDISADTFYDPRNRTIYAAMLTLNRLGKPLDALVLIETLRVDGKLESVGGVGYIQSLIDQTPTTAHAEHYIGIIRAKYLRRLMIERATKVVEKCYNEGDWPDPQAVLGEAEKAFLEIGVGGDGTMPWASAINQSFERLNDMFKSNGSTFEGLSTGLTHLDEKLQGLKQSEMIVIAARPSVGKTSLAMNIAESCALGLDMNNVPVKTSRDDFLSRNACRSVDPPHDRGPREYQHVEIEPQSLLEERKAGVDAESFPGGGRPEGCSNLCRRFGRS